MGSDRENFCDYCKNYMQDYDLCRLTGRKPSFDSKCADYNEKEGVVKKNPKRKETALERTIFNIISAVCVIALAVWMIYNYAQVKEWVTSLFKDKTEVPAKYLEPTKLPEDAFKGYGLPSGIKPMKDESLHIKPEAVPLNDAGKGML